MTGFRLRSYDESPPGLFRYSAVENGIKLKFGPSPMIEEVARMLSQARKANNLPRSEVKQSLEDVDQQTCARLGNMPRYCVPCEQTPGAAPIIGLGSSSPIVTPCGGCGAKVG